MINEAHESRLMSEEEFQRLAQRVIERRRKILVSFHDQAVKLAQNVATFITQNTDVAVRLSAPEADGVAFLNTHIDVTKRLSNLRLEIPMVGTRSGMFSWRKHKLKLIVTAENITLAGPYVTSRKCNSIVDDGYTKAEAVLVVPYGHQVKQGRGKYRPARPEKLPINIDKLFEGIAGEIASDYHFPFKRLPGATFNTATPV